MAIDKKRKASLKKQIRMHLRSIDALTRRARQAVNNDQPLTAQSLAKDIGEIGQSAEFYAGAWYQEDSPGFLENPSSRAKEVIETIRNTLRRAELEIAEVRYFVRVGNPGLTAAAANRVAKLAKGAAKFAGIWSRLPVDNPRGDSLLSSPRAPAVALISAGGVAVAAALLAKKKG